MPVLAAVALATCSAIALYCLAYSALAGTPESVGQAFGWAVSNVLPWLLAFEGGKRSQRPASVLLVLAAAFLVSLLLGMALAGSATAIGFEAVRRLPGLFVTAGLIALVRFMASRQPTPTAENIGLPLAPEQIEWVKAAGNYIEIRAAGRTLIQRSSLATAERELLDHGFVRIHRSMLVRRNGIARVRPNDVVLEDGTSLKTGKRYRSRLSN